jgi:hypothetical protein
MVFSQLQIRRREFVPFMLYDLESFLAARLSRMTPYGGEDAAVQALRAP